MFFKDKYRPKSADEFVFHRDEINHLKEVSKDNSIPHMIFCGPSGSGKRTMIDCFMEMVYDKDVHKLSTSIFKIPGSANNIQEVSIKQSNYHIIIEPNNNNFDKYLIQEVVKEYARRVSLHFGSNKTFKTVLINDADNLPYLAQTSLRRTMEIHSRTCRFIMVCNSLSRVINPIRSRCCSLKVSSPSRSDIFRLIHNICTEEEIPMTIKDYSEITRLADGDVKKALWMIQLKQHGLDYRISYDHILSEIVKKLLTKQLDVALSIRSMIYDVMITNIDGTSIITNIVDLLMKQKELSDNQKTEIVTLACRYERNLIKGRHEIMHIEAFINGVLYTLIKIK